jgi:hypothetical protein
MLFVCIMLLLRLFKFGISMLLTLSPLRITDGNIHVSTLTIKGIFSFCSCFSFHTISRFEKENDMNNLKLLVLGGLFLSSVFLSEVVQSSENESWSVQSTEKQFEKTSEVIYKTSKDSKVNVLPLTPIAQSKTATSVNNKKKYFAKTLTVRPQAKAFDQEFWIFDAWVVLFRDDDGDGYFSHFSVEFDADTQYSSADVYARLYLGKDEVFREYHTTSDFNVFSDSSDDSFVVESELLNGFPAGEYEVLIELYDTYNDELVAVFDGNDDADLYLLSLESKEYEYTQVVIVREHGGSVSLWGVLLLPFLLITRQYRSV